MKKVLKIISFFVLIILLTSCGENKQLLSSEGQVVIDDKTKEFNEIIENIYESQKDINDSNFFQINCVHAESPGAWGDGMGELYYYSDNGYYLWNESDYAYAEREVAKAGTWKIEDGRLKLNELYIMYLDGGHLEETIGCGGEFVEDLVDYEIIIKESNKIIDMKIENQGLSNYAKDVYGENKDDTYLLNSTDIWFSGVPASIDDMNWINYYYNSKIKNKIENNTSSQSGSDIDKQNQYDEIGEFYDGVAVVKKGMNYGYINLEGKEIVPCIYEIAYKANSGILRVGKDGKYGYINLEGKEIVPCIYDEGWNHPVDGLIIVEKDNLRGCINLEGEEVIPCIYEYIDYIDDYLLLAKKNNSWFHVNFKNNIEVIKKVEIIENEYLDIGNFSENLAYVKKDAKWGYINNKGEEVIPCIYEDAGEFREGLAPVKMNGKYGYINNEGEEVIPYIYEDAGEFGEGLAPVKMNGKYGYINNKGEEVITYTYKWAGTFYEDLAYVKKEDKWGYINKEEKEIIPCIYDWLDFGNAFDTILTNDLASACRDMQYGFVDKKGREIVTCLYDSYVYINENSVVLIDIQNEDAKYEEVYSFHEGFAVIKKDGKYGYINEKGEEVVPCIYESASDFSDGMASIYKQGDIIGFIDYNGEELILDGYEDRCHYYSEGLVYVKKNGKWGYIDKKGKEVIPCIYNQASSFENGKAEVDKDGEKVYINKQGKVLTKYQSLDYYDDRAIVEKGGKYGYVNKEGKEIVPCIYEEAVNYSEGLAFVKYYGVWQIIDKKGNTVVTDIKTKWIEETTNSSSIYKNIKIGQFNNGVLKIWDNGKYVFIIKH